MWQPHTLARLQRPASFGAERRGAIGQIVKGKRYNYYSDGQNPTSCCDSGEYDYFYDALGNVNGVLDSGGQYYRWEMDAMASMPAVQWHATPVILKIHLATAGSGCTTT